MAETAPAEAVVRNQDADPAKLLEGIFLKQKEDTFTVERARIVDACRRLHEGGFEHLTLITAIDWKRSWEIVYHITKYGRKGVVTLRVTLPRQDPTIPSIVSVWPGAGWHERETYDLMGIRFAGNPDLRRILLPDDFEGHPLRKEVKYGNTS
jgi:NADH:ubiquinone oxidoreductase subunit C